MPDLTIEIMQQCEAGLRGRVFNINGYSQVVAFDERTEGTCTCKAFKFSRSIPKTCKHLDEAARQLCNYHEQADGPPTIDSVCPKCGGPTTYVRVAV